LPNGASCSASYAANDGTLRPAIRFTFFSRADFALRGFTISFVMLARVASHNSFLAIFLIERP
jgi:hypothetical protein